jgi:outer membrane protein TolC
MTGQIGDRLSFLILSVIISALLVLSTGNLPAEVLSLSLEDAIALSLEKNEDVRVAWEMVREREARIGEAWGDILPSLTGEFNYNRNLKVPVIFFDRGSGLEPIPIGEDNAYDISLTLQQDIDILGRVPRAISAANLYSDIGHVDFERVESEVVFNVKSLYYGVILAAELKSVAEMTLEQAEANLGQVEAMLREGTRSRFDLLRARVEVANRRPELIQARHGEELSRSRFKRAVGLPLDTEIELTDELTFESFDMSINEGTAIALEKRPELRTVRMEERMSDIEVTLSKLDYFPSLLLLSRYSWQGQTSEKFFPENDEFAQSWFAGVGFTWPIFDGLKTRSRINQARAQQSMSRYRKKKAEEEVRLDVIEAFRDLESSREEIMSQEANVEEAEEAYRLASIRFANGLATQLEVNDVELALNRARTNYIQSLYNYNVARARVEKAVGKKVR